MKRMAIAFGLTLLAFQGFAQHKGEFWAGYILSADIGSRWALWQDSHFLTRSFIIGRTGISYRIKPHSTLTAGYAYLQTAASFSTSLVRPEHRPWAQIDSRWKINGNTRYSLRFRYDARFRQNINGNELTSGYIFYNRFRMMNRLHRDIGIWKNYRLSVNFLSEVLFNAGKQLPSNRIDQFRTFVMFGFNRNRNTLQLGPHWRYLPDAAVNSRHRLGVTIWYLVNCDFRGQGG